MRYYATASGPKVREAIAAGQLGQIVTPASGNAITAGAAWCADNACYTGRYPGDDTFLRWLGRRAEQQARCAFAVAPDVVGDAAATWRRSAPMLDRIRAAGYPAALAAQDGIQDTRIDWTSFDALCVGGSTTFKLSGVAADLVAEAVSRHVPAHMGRVNSRTRLLYAARIGCTSADGTYLGYAPDINLPKLLGWLADIHHT